MATKETETRIEERPSFDSYADRVHRYLAYRCHEASTNRNGFVKGFDGSLKFRGLGGGIIMPVYTDKVVPYKAITNFIENSGLPTLYKHAHFKALVRIGILYGKTTGNRDQGIEAIQTINEAVSRIRDTKSKMRKPRFFELYEAVNHHYEEKGTLPSQEELSDLCRDKLRIDIPDYDPTRKFRENNRNLLVDNEYRGECARMSWEDRCDPGSFRPHG